MFSDIKHFLIPGMLSVFVLQEFCACQFLPFFSTKNSYGVHTTEVADPIEQLHKSTQLRNNNKKRQKNKTKCAGWDHHKKTLTRTLHEINNTALVLVSNVLYKVSLI